MQYVNNHTHVKTTLSLLPAIQKGKNDVFFEEIQTERVCEGTLGLEQDSVMFAQDS
jgi:hypothetical protein